MGFLPDIELFSKKITKDSRFVESILAGSARPPYIRRNTLNTLVQNTRIRENFNPNKVLPQNAANWLCGLR